MGAWRPSEGEAGLGRGWHRILAWPLVGSAQGRRRDNAEQAQLLASVNLSCRRLRTAARILTLAHKAPL